MGKKRGEKKRKERGGRDERKQLEYKFLVTTLTITTASQLLMCVAT